MNNPYLLQGPATISFSGGRTSAYMLWHILDAHGGRLPPDVHVLFANTGKERPETLDFIEKCSQRWGVRVRWLEWERQGGKEGFREVHYGTARRGGSPSASWSSGSRCFPTPCSASAPSTSRWR